LAANGNLNCPYVPRVGDIIIGSVVDVDSGGWIIDIKSSRLAYLTTQNVLSKPFEDRNKLIQVLKNGDSIVAKIAFYEGTYDPRLTVAEPGLGKLSKGQLTCVPPDIIPAIIGRKGIMISTLKTETNCQIILGLNGIILVTGKNVNDENLAIAALKRMETENLQSSYVERITQMLRDEKQKRINQTSTVPTIRCFGCGIANPQDFEFCGKCGARLRDDNTKIYK
jgi:exosome complex component RRP4